MGLAQIVLYMDREVGHIGVKGAFVVHCFSGLINNGFTCGPYKLPGKKNQVACTLNVEFGYIPFAWICPRAK